MSNQQKKKQKIVKP